MLIVLSPTKTLKPVPVKENRKYSTPEFLNKSEQLVKELREFTVQELTTVMNISPKLAQLNYERYKNWKLPFTADSAYPALFTFKGEVFNGLDADTLNDGDIDFARKHLRILSGLYGILRPMDLIMPYRLEMGTRYPFSERKNLYEFWKETITKAIHNALSQQNDEILINLASSEYFKSINIKLLKAQIITPEFKEYKNGTYKTVTIYTKKARGLMARFILQNRISNPEELKLFEDDGYFFNPELTKNNFHPVFTRG